MKKTQVPQSYHSGIEIYEDLVQVIQNPEPQSYHSGIEMEKG